MPVDPMRDEPIVPEAPMPPAPEAPEAPLPAPAKKEETPAEKANELSRIYDKLNEAIKLIEPLMDEENKEAPEAAAEPMSPEEGDAASKALIGL